jgi:crotonobetainyl-CoA:carnitine CoA-transferase CaiB-like acyl-CoA transferase
MTQIMKGVKVLEVAQHTFVPSAGAILSDWGADVFLTNYLPAQRRKLKLDVE